MICRRLENLHSVCASKFSYVEKLTEIMLSIILNILKNYTEIELLKAYHLYDYVLVICESDETHVEQFGRRYHNNGNQLVKIIQTTVNPIMKFLSSMSCWQEKFNWSSWNIRT